MWNYRNFLETEEKSLTKILKSVNWDSISEVEEATKRLESYPLLKAEEALELLNQNFKNSAVRNYAIKCFGEIDDDELLLYLPQLVQALKFEDFNNSNSILGSFLIKRASSSFKLANFFYWTLQAELEKENQLQVFSKVLTTFVQSLEDDNEEQNLLLTNLKKQTEFVKAFSKLLNAVINGLEDRSEKTLRLQQLLMESEICNFEPFPHPLNPEVEVKAIVPSKVLIYKSHWMPVKLTFLTTVDQEFVTIFKHTIDMRQDQLILQLIERIDKILLDAEIDLELTPYKILPLSPDLTFMEFIESMSIEEILDVDGSIDNFLQKSIQNSDKLETEVMETYVKSCAGYSVITYILGVGDRHYDNVLLTKNGNLIQIDFSHVFGQDKKPLPSPMKLTKEMIEAMGGVDSENFHNFKTYCFKAFLEIRKHSTLLLNLMSLMADSSIPDISYGPEKAIKLVEDNLKLNLSENEAIEHLEQLIETSIAAVMPNLVNIIHKIVNRLRK